MNLFPCEVIWLSIPLKKLSNIAKSDEFIVFSGLRTKLEIPSLCEELSKKIWSIDCQPPDQDHGFPKLLGISFALRALVPPGCSSLSCKLQASLKAYTLSFLWPHALFGLKNVLHVCHWYLKVALPVVFWPCVPKLLYFLEPGPGLSWCWSCCIPACYLWMTFIDKHKIIFIPSLLLLYCWNNLVCLRLDSTVFVKNLCNRNGGPLPAVLPGYLYPK